MARLCVALDNQHQAEAVIGDEWLRIWPDDFTFIRYVDDGGEVPVFNPPPALAAEAEASEEADVQQHESTGNDVPDDGNQVSHDVSQPQDTPASSRSDLSETGSLYLPRQYGN